MRPILPAEPGRQMVGFFAGDFGYEWVQPHYPLSRATIQNRPARTARPAWNSPAFAKCMKHGLGESRNDTPRQRRGQTHEVQSRPGCDGCAGWIGFDGRPGRGVLEISVRRVPYCPGFGGGAAEFACLVKCSKGRYAMVKFGGQRRLPCRRLATPGNAAVECLMREADDAVDEITEDVGEVLVYIGHEPAGVEVGVRRFRSVGDQPPAPEVGWQFLQCRDR